MTNLLRPEARDWLLRWREVLTGAAVALLGLWSALTTFGVTRWLSVALILIGAALIWTGIQRIRFRQGGGGAGVVQIDERRLMYFGPLTGGVIDMDDLTRLVLDPSGHPPHWLLSGVGGQSLAIPVNAEGADALFDLFAALPGIKTEHMLEVLARTPDAQVTIWKSDRLRLH